MSESNMFLKLGDVKGGAIEGEHKDWIEISNYRYTVSMDITSGAGGHQKTGRAKFDHIVLTKRIDKSTPLLAEHAASGTFFEKNVEIEMMEQAGTTKAKQMKITLEGVYISGVEHEGDGATKVEEKLSLSFNKIKWEVTPVINGKAQATVRGGWDRDKNEKWGG